MFGVDPLKIFHESLKNLYIDVFGPYLGPKILFHRGYFSHVQLPIIKFDSPALNTFWENGLKPEN